MAGIIISPSTENKIRSRNAAVRLRHGLPEFKDILRQRFRKRIRESRGKLVDKFREIDDTSDSFRLALKRELSDIVRMVDRDSSEAMDFIEEDGLTEHEDWMLHQYNLLLSDDDIMQQLYEESQQVVCPICFKGYLQTNVVSNLIQCCSCTLKLPARASPQEISVHLSHSIDAHDDSGCKEQLRFIISEEESFVYLYAVCSSCLFLNLVV